MHEWMPLNSQWLVLKIGGADFLCCWATDSIWLECAESLITDSFHSDLCRALSSFRAILRVNIVVYSLLLLDLTTHYHES